MKILAVMGSPRLGKTYEAVQLVEAAMKAKGEVDFEYLHLKDYEVTKCNGCHGCIFKEGFSCPQSPDIKRIVEKMESADGIILASPVYSNTVTTLMKGYIDHLSYLWHRPRYFGKKALILATGGGMFGYMHKYMDLNLSRWGFDVVAKVGLPHLDALNEKFKAKALQQLRVAAEGFYMESEGKKLRKPRMKELFWFNIWKGNTITFPDATPADLEYWTNNGWIKANYYYEAKIALWKKLVIVVFNKMGKVFMKGMYKVN